MRQPTFDIPHGGRPRFVASKGGGPPARWAGMARLPGRIVPSPAERPRAILLVSDCRFG